jgi:nicotinate-nucleotide adenylyltransferase
MKVAFYGGSFNPPHVGHVLAAAYLTTVAGFERVLVVPVFEHAFDKALLDFEERVALCRLAFAQLANVEVSTIEAELSRPSFTVKTIEALRQRHPEWEFCLAVGADVLPEIARWHRSDELLRLAPLHVMGRRGYDNPAGIEPLLPEVSSSELRQWLQAPEAAQHRAQLSQLLPLAVSEQIRTRGLYR